MIYWVLTEDFELEGSKKQEIKKIMTENDLYNKKFRVEDIVWLKKRDISLEKLILIEVWLDLPEAVKWIIDNGLLIE